MPSHRQRYVPTNQAVYGGIDPTEVPAVTVRELATALKVLADEVAALAQASQWSDDDFRRVEQFFWLRCGRDRQRKTAALVRLRSLIAVSRARILQALLARHGTAGALRLVETAASMRLNSRVGFSPIKVSCAVMAALREAEPPTDVADPADQSAETVAADLLRVDVTAIPAEFTRWDRQVQGPLQGPAHQPF